MQYVQQTPDGRRAVLSLPRLTETLCTVSGQVLQGQKGAIEDKDHLESAVSDNDIVMKSVEVFSEIARIMYVPISACLHNKVAKSLWKIEASTSVSAILVSRDSPSACSTSSFTSQAARGSFTIAVREPLGSFVSGIRSFDCLFLSYLPICQVELPQHRFSRVLLS